MNSNIKRLACFFGGRSSEHEISIISALQFIASVDIQRYVAIPVYIDPNGKWWTGPKLLDRTTYKQFSITQETLQSVTLIPTPGTCELTSFSNGWLGQLKKSTIPFDIAVPLFHGQFGEDGCIQGLFEVADVPYTGSPITASAVSMNKFLCKQVSRGIGVPTLPAVLVNKSEFQTNSDVIAPRLLRENLAFPVFVKPNNLGSSVGVGVANDASELLTRLATVFKLDTEALVEQCLSEMYELNIAARPGPITSVVEMPFASKKTLTYEDKYLRGGKGAKGKGFSGASQGMASLVRVIDPPEIPHQLKETISGYAKALFTALGCSGVGRFDFMVDANSNTIYFNELNPLPGSLAFYLWEKSTPKLLYPQIIDCLVEEGLRLFAQKTTLKRDIGFLAL